MHPVQHIFLTGFMGSGKSTLGKKLAPLLKFPFIDLDEYIEKKEGLSIPAIFKTQGEAAFREKELACLREILASGDPKVIALGGGTICYKDNLSLIKQHGLLIYLELPPAILADRIGNSKKERPLLKKFSGAGLLEAITEKLAAREPFYAQAHFSLSSLNLTPQLLQHAILEALHI